MPSEKIESKIYVIRQKKVMLDRDLALLYNVETRTLNQAVGRNPERFPEDFMFQLNQEEVRRWMSQIVISNKERKGLRKMPYVFTEQGVAMLSSVLKSRVAILVNIQIIRTFVKLKEASLSYRDIFLKIEAMEKKYDQQFQVVFKAIKMLLDDRTKDGGPSRF
ncbi:MAG: ORF6N domain-containing protein [Candidatus Omnitrophica bacterium]|nr:ORF6N domain-containing protein [Candidatus Omnitrophota bacterium]